MRHGRTVRPKRISNLAREDRWLMFYLELTNQGITGIESFGVIVIYAEVDAEGFVQRELGLSTDNLAVHKYPSNHDAYAKYGVLDLVKFDTKPLQSDLSADQFEQLWSSDA